MAEETVTLPVMSERREKIGEMQVPAPLIAGPVREHLLHQMVLSQLASRRSGTAATKTKGLVRGGGKKPWRQKGTGRARAGSSRSPLWAGGGTIFGPQPRDYSYHLPKSARRAALRAAIATRHAGNALLVVDKVALAEPKTKRMAEYLRGLGIDGSALVVLDHEDAGVARAARNLPNVKVLLVQGLNVYDILGRKALIITRAALEQIATRLTGDGEVTV